MSDTELLRTALHAINDLQARLDQHEHGTVAIVGMGCHLPGASDPTSLWQLLMDGVDAVGEIPADRWDADALYDPDPTRTDRMSTRWGGFLDDVIGFDPAPFGISPREAASMDPQQRLLLTVTWRALEDAGIAPESLFGTQTGVFIGIGSMDYALLRARSTTPIDAYGGTGVLQSVAAGRIAYWLGLQGPAVSIDTACSSSLVALDQAIRAIRGGRCRQALVGGVNAILAPDGAMYFSRVGAMAADGRCKAFDARADGYVRSEGCVVLALKRTADAVADGDRIWATLLGSAVNHDGRSAGLTAPSVDAQRRVLEAALRDASIQASQVDLIEGHGTGTALGDPIEVDALRAVYGARRDGDRPVYLGSIKANLGHTEATAGLAGVAKAALALSHAEIPPQIHFERPNEAIDLSTSALTIPTVPTPWPRGGQGIAAVSSFGLSGTNAHVVLKRHEPSPSAPAGPHTGATILTLSAATDGARLALVDQWKGWLAETPSPFAGICNAAATRRAALSHRIAVVSPSATACSQLLEDLSAGRPTDARLAMGTARAVQPAVLLFSGQGGQWPSMGRQLCRDETAFHEAIVACSDALVGVGGPCTADIVQQGLEPTDIDVVQPVLFSLQVALAATLQSWGISVGAVIGHSMGEVAAAVVGGWLSLEEGAKVITERSRGLKRVAGDGAMAVVGLDAEATGRHLPDRGVSIAAENGPLETVVSGDRAGVAALVERLTVAGVFARQVAVDVASHTAAVDPILDGFAQDLGPLGHRRGRFPMYSTVTPQAVGPQTLNARYWSANLRQRVRLREAVARAMADGFDTFIEISPHPLLCGAIAASDPSPVALPTLKRPRDGHEADERCDLLAVVAALWVAGHSIDWARVHGPRIAPQALPPYPFDAIRPWFEEGGPAAPPPSVDLADGHPLLTDRRRIADRGLGASSSWRSCRPPVDAEALAQHVVLGRAVLPAAALLDAAMAAGERVLGVPCDLHHVRLLAPTDLGEDVVFTVAGAGSEVALFGLGTDDSDRVTGVLVGRTESLGVLPGAVFEHREACSTVLTPEAVYAQFAAAGIEYGDAFRPIRRLWCGDGIAVGRLERTGAWSGSWGIATAWLDGILQVAVGAQRVERPWAYVPVAVDRLAVTPLAPQTDVLWVIATVREDGPSRLVADLIAIDEDERVVVRVEGLRAKALMAPDRFLPFAEVQWQAVDPDVAPTEGPERWCLVGATDPAWTEVVQNLADRGVTVETEDANGLDPLEGYDHAIFVAPSAPEHHGSQSEAAFAGALSTLDRLVESTRLTLVTRGRPGLPGAGTPSQPGHAVLWGLGRTLTNEAPERRVHLIDWTGTEAAAMAEALGAVGGQTVLRGSDRFQPRLVPPAPPTRPLADGHDSIALWRAEDQDTGCVAVGEREGSGESVVSVGRDRWRTPPGSDLRAATALAAVAAPALAALAAARLRAPDRIRIEAVDSPSQRMLARLAQARGLRIHGPDDPVEADRSIEVTVGGAAPIAGLAAEGEALLAETAVTGIGGGSAVAPAQTLRSDRAFIVTGAFGGIGPTICRWLCERGARHLVLVGRRTPDPSAIEALGDLPARIETRVADISDGDAVFALTSDPIGGIVHLAAHLDDGLVATQSVDRWRQVLAPKVDGAYHLHRLSLDHDLQLFWMFSSMAALLGSPGQGAYAAANAYLDALAGERHHLGLPATSFGWGLWGQVGRVSDPEVGASMGLHPIPTDIALEVLDRALVHQPVHPLVPMIDLEGWRRRVPTAVHSPLFGLRTAPTARQGSAYEAWRSASASGTGAATLLAHLGAELGAILRTAPDSLGPEAPFASLGVDSMMSLELRNRIEATLGLSVPATIAFRFPTLASLADHLDEVLRGDPVHTHPEAR